jgi:hypothetical protein
MGAIERMYSKDGDLRSHFPKGTLEFEEKVAEIEEQFGDQPANDWASISSPQWNSIYQDDIVSTIVNRNIPWYLRQEGIFAAGRKFFLRNSWVYDKIYLITTQEDCSLPRPVNATPLAIGYLVSVYGQPGEDDLSRYKCLYFACDNHSEVEEWAGEVLPKGGYKTFYAATFDEDADFTRLRMKSYVYDSPGIYSDLETQIATIIAER